MSIIIMNKTLSRAKYNPTLYGPGLGLRSTFEQTLDKLSNVTAQRMYNRTYTGLRTGLRGFVNLIQVDH